MTRTATFTAALLFSLPLISSDAAEAKVDFKTQIEPILAETCYKCHGEKDKGDLRLNSKAAILAGGASAEDGLKTVVPGKPMESLMYELTSLLDADDPDIMPPKGDPLTKDQQALLKQWIEEGAEFGDWVESEIETGPIAPVLPEAPEAEPLAVNAIIGDGALVMPLAANTNLLNVDYRGNAENIGDSHLEKLNAVAEQVYWLGLAKTKVSDAGLAHLKALKHLNRLHLEQTAVTDAGLAHLAALENLEYLNLYGTQVSDAGLKHLAALKKLKKLYLWQSQVTEAGAKQLGEALPNLQINLGWKAPTPAPAPEAKPAEADAGDAGELFNDKCPVSGKPVDATQFVIFNDKKVGFCCGNCKGKFEKDPKPFIAKVQAKK